MRKTSKASGLNQSQRKKAINPLLTAWRTPLGLPPFERIKPEHYEPAFQNAMLRHREELRDIGANAKPATFTNTIVALERSGALLNRVAEVFFNLSSAETSPELQDIERRIAPKLANHQSALYLDQKLFRRIEALYEQIDDLGLDDEQKRLLSRTYTAFVRAGAALNSKARKRVAEINAKLAELTTKFSQNVLADEQNWRLALNDESDLAGLPEGVRAAAARTAADLKSPAGHVITLQRSSIEPFLQFSARRDLREEAFKAWTRRGEMGGRTDNRSVAAEIVALRAEFARLMGFRSYAAYALDDTMAKTPDAVRDLLTKVWQPAVARAAEEREALAALVREDGGNYRVEAWDWRYLAEKQRRARYDLDEAELRPYFTLENMIAAAFDTAKRLFGLRFKEEPGAPRYHPDVRVWSVTDAKGRDVGIFLGDYLARPSKRSGAWMSNFRAQHKLGRGQRPIIVNVMNFAAGVEGGSTLLSLDDARTLFHEFGHGLHGLLSDVTYPSLSGTSVSRDFVELPSQLYEHWLTRPEVLERFAHHAKTGRPMPAKLMKKITASRSFNQGFATAEYVASALVDMDLHDLESASDLDVTAFEAERLKRLGMPREIVMRHRIPHFQHIMGGYAAGYYSYLWSEVMDADAFAAFEETGNVFDAKTAARLKAHIYAAGNRRDPQEAYEAFRGRAPRIDALLKKRGFAA